jgi:hypothetical protein
MTGGCRAKNGKECSAKDPGFEICLREAEAARRSGQQPGATGTSLGVTIGQ